MSNFYLGLSQWHEALQDAVLEGVTSDIETINNYWGNPEPESSKVLDLVLGAITIVAGFAQPELGEPIASLVGVFEAIRDAAKGKDPKDISGALRESLGSAFKLLHSGIKTIVAQVFMGGNSKAKKADCETDLCRQIREQIHYHRRMVLSKGAEARKLSKIFANGAFLDINIVRKSITRWIDSAINLIKEGLVV